MRNWRKQIVWYTSKQNKWAPKSIKVVAYKFRLYDIATNMKVAKQMYSLFFTSLLHVAVSKSTANATLEKLLEFQDERKTRLKNAANSIIWNSDKEQNFANPSFGVFLKSRKSFGILKMTNFLLRNYQINSKSVWTTSRISDLLVVKSRRTTQCPTFSLWYWWYKVRGLWNH